MRREETTPTRRGNEGKRKGRKGGRHHSHRSIHPSRRHRRRRRLSATSVRSGFLDDEKKAKKTSPQLNSSRLRRCQHRGRSKIGKTWGKSVEQRTREGRVHFGRFWSRAVPVQCSANNNRFHTHDATSCSPILMVKSNLPLHSSPELRSFAVSLSFCRPISSRLISRHVVAFDLSTSLWRSPPIRPAFRTSRTPRPQEDNSLGLQTIGSFVAKTLQTMSSIFPRSHSKVLLWAAAAILTLWPNFASFQLRATLPALPPLSRVAFGVVCGHSE